MRKFALLALALSVSMPAFATDTVGYAMPAGSEGQNCKMVETVTVGMNFNVQNIELSKAKALMDEKLAEVESAAKTLEIAKMELQNYSYNIYSNGGGGCGMDAMANSYQFNGSLSFTLPNADKTDALMDALAQKGFYVNFNMNAYRQCQ